MILAQTEQARRIELTPVDELARQLFSFADVKAEVVPIEYIEDGVLKFRFHKYQKLAMRARERFILLLGGTQSGKTSFGKIWLHREICLRGPGDYLAVAPTYTLMKKKMLPEFLHFFQTILNLGTYHQSDKIFTVSEEGEISLFGARQETKTLIHFGHAQDPDALESATALAAWLDECGQSKFKLGSYEAIMRRLSLHIGRVLMTTTPYNLGWLKQKIWDIWQAGQGKLHSIKVISFPSIANPSFPKQEYERARRDLPLWKFDMFYRAIFTRPAGMIYDCFDPTIHKVKRFPIPANWRRYAGVDFGGVNTAAVKIAENPDNGNLYLFATYHEGGRTAEGHARSIQETDPVSIAYGGAGSEGQWRLEFGRGGLPIYEPPIKDVEVGINRVYGLFQTQRLYIFDDLDDILDEVCSYARETDDMGNPTEAIADKSTYHLLDALRYIGSHLNNTNFSILW
jgi:hypothetical protein